MKEDLDRRFLELAIEASKKSDCYRTDRKIGAVIVKNNKVVGTGANLSPSNIKDCLQRNTCLRKDLKIESGTRSEICYNNCAEMVALLNAMEQSKTVKGGTLYCTHKPCSRCMLVLLGAGLKRFVYKEEYPDSFSDELIKESGVECIQIF